MAVGRLAAAALIQSLAWELLYAAPVALNKKKKKKENQSPEKLCRDDEAEIKTCFSQEFLLQHSGNESS